MIAKRRKHLRIVDGEVGISVHRLSKRGRYTMLAASWATVFCSFGYAFAYLASPRTVQTSLLGSLTTHVVWAAIQLALGLGIALAMMPGGYHQRIAHTVGGIVQSVYLALWLCTTIFLSKSYFVWPSLLVVVVVHWALAGLQWPTRAEVKGRANG